MEKKWINLGLVILVLIGVIFAASFLTQTTEPNIPAPPQANFLQAFTKSNVSTDSFQEALNSFDYSLEPQSLSKLESELKLIQQSGSSQDKQNSRLFLEEIELEKKQTALGEKLLSFEEESLLDACQKLEEINSLPPQFLDALIEADTVNDNFENANLPQELTFSVNVDLLEKETDVFDHEVRRMLDTCIVTADLIENGEI